MNIIKQPFGVLSSGHSVDCYTLDNGEGMTVSVLNYGGIIHRINLPDASGHTTDVVLGCDDIAGYEKQRAYLGAIIGRFANRLAKGKGTVGDEVVQLSCNEGENQLHGGRHGFNQKLWQATPFIESGLCGVKLSLYSPDGDEGYPGNLNVTVSYSLNSTAELVVTYYAETDRATLINLTQHSYFNLQGGGDCLGHQLRLNASRYIPVDNQLLAGAEPHTVASTPMDFRQWKRIGQEIDSHFTQLVKAGGDDHCWIADNYQTPPCEPSKIAEVYEPLTGRTLEVLTTQPGVQFYTGNFLSGTPAKGGGVYCNRAGFCLETQHFPNSPNIPHYPSTVITPEKPYYQRTIFRFGVR